MLISQFELKLLFTALGDRPLHSNHDVDELNCKTEVKSENLPNVDFHHHHMNLSAKTPGLCYLKRVEEQKRRSRKEKNKLEMEEMGEEEEEVDVEEA